MIEGGGVLTEIHIPCNRFYPGGLLGLVQIVIAFVC
jgi:hypothetical protein